MSQSILHKVLSVLLSRAGELVVGVLMTPLLVRVLGSSAYGEFATVLAVSGIIMILINDGVFDGVRKYIAEDRTSASWMADVFAFYFQIALLFYVLSAVVIVGGIHTGVVDVVFSSELVVYFYVLLVVLLFQVVFDTIRGALMGMGLETKSEPLLVVYMICYAVAGVGLAYIGFGLLGVFAGMILSLGLSSILGLRILVRKVDVSTVFHWPASSLPKREMMLFNYLSVGLAVFIGTLYYVDVIMLRAFVGNTETGYYRAALVAAEFLWFAPMAIQLVFLQSSSELWHRQENAEIERLVSKAIRYTLLFTILVGMVMALLAEPFVRTYFGSEFVPAAVPLLILLPGCLGFAVARPIYAVGQGKGEFRPLIAATGGAAGINVVLNFALIPSYGIVGAAVATSTSYGSMLLFHTLAARQIGFDPLVDLRGVRIVATALCSAPFMALPALLLTSDLLSLVIVPAVSVAVFFTSAILCGALDLEEVSILIPDPNTVLTP